MPKIVEVSSFTREQAEKFTKDADIAFNWLARNWDKAIQGKVWLALDYNSFTEWFVGRKLNKYKLNGIVISKAIEQMKEDNPDITVRDIADVLDMPKSTVQDTITESVRIRTEQFVNSVQSNTGNNGIDYTDLSDKQEAETTPVSTSNVKIPKRVSTKVLAGHISKIVDSLSDKSSRMKADKKDKDVLITNIDELRKVLDSIENELR